MTSMKGDITHMQGQEKSNLSTQNYSTFYCMHEWVHSTPPDCNILQDSYSPVNWPILTLWGGGLTFIGLFNGNSSMSTICPQITPRGIQRKTLKAFPALIFDMTEPCCLRVCPFLLPAIQGHNNALAFLQDHLDNSYV